VGMYAKGNNTTISVIGIDGTDGALSSLSACAEITSGSVNILHPLGMKSNKINLIQMGPKKCFNYFFKIKYRTR
jgi:hypothetical protein